MGCAVRGWILPNFGNGFTYLHCLNGHIQRNIFRSSIFSRGPRLGMLTYPTPPLLRRRQLFVATSRDVVRNKSPRPLAFSTNGWKDGFRYTWQYFSAINRYARLESRR